MFETSKTCTMTVCETSTTCTIELPNRPPVRIYKAAWPVIARGSYYDFDAEHEDQATSRWSADIRVRRHKDGRAVVYGVHSYWTTAAAPKKRVFTTRAGALVPKGADLTQAIRDVGVELARAARLELARSARTAERSLTAYITAAVLECIATAVRDCIADLPPRDLE